MRRSKYLRPAVIAATVAVVIVALVWATIASGVFKDPLRPATAEEVLAAKAGYGFGNSIKHLPPKHFYVAQKDFETDNKSDQAKVIIVLRNEDGDVPAKWLGGELGHTTLLFQEAKHIDHSYLDRIKAAFALYDPICRLVDHGNARPAACDHETLVDDKLSVLTPLARDSKEVRAWTNNRMPFETEGTWYRAGNGRLNLTPTTKYEARKHIILSAVTMVNGQLGHDRLYSDREIDKEFDLEPMTVSDRMCALVAVSYELRQSYVGDFVPPEFMAEYGPGSEICPYLGPSRMK